MNAFGAGKDCIITNALTRPLGITAHPPSPALTTYSPMEHETLAPAIEHQVSGRDVGCLNPT